MQHDCGPVRAMDLRYIYLAVLVVVVVVVAILRSRQVPPYVKQMQREDGDDPLKRWARGCYAVNFGPASPELRGVEDCRQALSDRSIHNEQQKLFRPPGRELPGSTQPEK